MEKGNFQGNFLLWKVALVILAWLGSSFATLSPSGINYEVVALMAIKYELNDPFNVLENWDINSVDPCGWRMVTCSADGAVSALGLPSQSLSGTLSPGIGNLTNLQSVLLQNNAISGPIPSNIGKLEKLQTLDLSNNQFSFEIPSSLGNLKNLNYLRLNNNSLSGPLPESLSSIQGLTLVDLSYNNLSGSLPKISARTFNIAGNPLICGSSSENNCSLSTEPLSDTPNALKAQAQSSGSRSRRVAVAFSINVGYVALLVLVVGLLLWLRHRHNKQIFFDVNGKKRRASGVCSWYTTDKDGSHPTLAGAVFVCSAPPSRNSGLVWRYLLSKPIAAIKVTLSLAAKAFATSLPLCKETFFSTVMNAYLVQQFVLKAYFTLSYKQGPSYIVPIPDLPSLLHILEEAESQLPQGCQTNETRQDTFSQVMGSDHHDRVRTMGLGVTPSRMWPSEPIRQQRVENEELKKTIIELKEQQKRLEDEQEKRFSQLVGCLGPLLENNGDFQVLLRGIQAPTPSSSLPP